MRIQISWESSARIGQWMSSGNTGLSSSYLASIALGGNPLQVNYPHDPADFKRCIALLDCLTMDEAMTVLLGASHSSEQWRKIYENWSNLYRLWSQEKEYNSAPLLYQAMKQLGL